MLLALTPAVSAADFDEGPTGMDWYVSVFGGWSHPTENFEGSAVFLSGPSTGTFATAEADVDDGFLAGIALGAHFWGWARGEAELSGHWHDADGFATVVYFDSISATPYFADIDGEANALFALANLWVDIPAGDMIRPYVGGGIGLGRLDVDLETSGGYSLIDDSDWAFAYQLGAGVAFGFTEHVAVDLGYRFKVISNAELDANTPAGGVEVETDYRSHNVLLGLRLTF